MESNITLNYCPFLFPEMSPKDFLENVINFINLFNQLVQFDENSHPVLATSCHS